MSSHTWQLFEQAMQSLAPAGRVGVAVSGGPDSMALLHLLCAWNQTAREKLDLVAVTVDHGLRPQSAREANAVSAWAEHLGVEHAILKWTGDKPGANIEARAREARYHLIGRWARQRNIKTVMTAHHRDDQAETFLMRLARGSGVSGLSAMAPQRPLGADFPSLMLQRPLLEITKLALTDLLEEVGQPWFEDPSNEDENHTRSKVRNMRQTFDLLDLGVDRLVATAQRMRDADKVLEKVAHDLWSEAARVTPWGEVHLGQGALLAAQADTRRRVLARTLKGVAGATFAPRYERLLRLEANIASGRIGNGVTLHGCKIVQKDETLTFMRETGRGTALVPPLDLGAIPLPQVWDGRFVIEDGEAPRNAQIRRLGDDGLKELKEAGFAMPPGVPSREVMMTGPAAWHGNALLAAPLAGYNPGVFKARFMLLE